MKSALSILTLFTMLSCQTNTSSSNRSGSITVEDIIKKHAEDFLGDKRIHSVSIALYANKKEHSMHYGEQNIGKNNPPTDSTFYELASVTKTFLGTMAAQAVLEDKISLDDKIFSYLDDEYNNFNNSENAITIKHILTHTAGFPNFPPTMENKKKFLEGLKQIEIISEPGKEFNYSNTAPEIMAYILEKVYDQPYRKLIYDKILRPNDMNQTKFNLNDIEKKRLITGYNANNEPQDHFQNNLWGGIGGLHSTTSDILKYMQYHLNEDNEVIKESHKTFFNTRYDFDIGYHWNKVKLGTVDCYRHHGGIWGMQNWIMVYPEENIGIAVFSNSSFDGIDDKLEKLSNNIFMEVRPLIKDKN